MTGRIFTLLFLSSIITSGTVLHAQSKSDRKTAKRLQADISFLASDDLAGRRTATDGEHKAADYIEKRYKEIKITPYKSQYRLPFNFVYGKEISPATQINIGNLSVPVNEEAFPMPFSGNKHMTSDILPDVMEQGSIWMISIYNDSEEASNPHFEAEKFMYERAKDAEKQGAAGIVFYDSFGATFPAVFNRHSEYEPLEIPIIYLSHTSYRKFIKDTEPAHVNGINIDLNVSVNRSERTGNNIAAYIDNKAKYTVIVGAHYDHLGFGEDGNSLFANAVKEHQVHHGADDNASGTAAVLEIAKWVKSKHLNHYNYLFLNFSGEELGLYGSKAFVKDQPEIDSMHIAYMINMDMVGRLNDSTHALTIGGVGTSPTWGDMVTMAGNDFKVVIDSAGQGPSDHTSFYNAGIPVLFLFTGTHKDYHKPTDRAEFINYKGEVQVIKYVDKVLAKLDKEQVKPAYTTTKQQTMGKSKFKVTLGIMPDYTFETGGVRVDGVSDNRPAMKAGIKQGDIITMLGDHKIIGMQSYMEALGKFTPGEKTQVTLTRDGKEMTLPLEFLAK
ncbi:MAG: peptidase [Flavipsychrobacter sp.]|nr:peptidase [Flavipsychrobacter sp.]